MGKVTAVVSGKGGVGKSTMVVGLGRALSNLKKRVLLIDCDAGLRTLDNLTGISETMVYDLSDVVNGTCNASNAIYNVQNSENLFVMPAPSSTETMPNAKLFEKFISVLKTYFDYIFLDAPAGLGDIFDSVLACADNILVVCTADPVSLRAGFKVHQIISLKGIKNKRLILNRYNKDLFDKIDIYEDLDRVIDETLIQLIGVVPEDRIFSSSFFKGENAPAGTPAMLAMKRIAARMCGENIPLKL